jgi:hypothetical protein
MTRRPPTVPLYVRIPYELRLRLDAAAHTDPSQPWRRGHLQDLVIDALHRAFPPLPSETTPEPGAEPAPKRKRATKRAARTKTSSRKRSTSAQLQLSA